MAADAVASETMAVKFGILGPLEVRRSGHAVPLGGPRQRAVLALLLLEANRVVSMDRLAEDVWGGDPPRGGPGRCRPMCFTCDRRWSRTGPGAPREACW
jgi:hypothetical protein